MTHTHMRVHAHNGLIMNLLEIIDTYQGTIKRDGRRMAEVFLKGIGINTALQTAIRVCFDDEGNRLRGH